MSLDGFNFDPMNRRIIHRGREIHLPEPPTPNAAHAPAVRWLGMTWIGEPWPKRIRFRSPIYLKPLPGCGCIYTLKNLWRTIIQRFK